MNGYSIIDVHRPDGTICQAKVDAEDIEKLSAYRWKLSRCYNGKCCAVSRICEAYYMHRFIMNAPYGARVFHRNGDALDNRKVNLSFRLAETNSVIRNKELREESIRRKGETQMIIDYLKRGLADGKHYFNSRRMSGDLGMSPTLIGSIIGVISHCQSGMTVERWSRGRSIWHVTTTEKQ